MWVEVIGRNISAQNLHWTNYVYYLCVALDIAEENILSY